MRTLAILMAAGSLSAAVMVSPPGATETLDDSRGVALDGALGGALDGAMAEAALKCVQTWPPGGAAIVLNGAVAWSGPSLRDVTRDEIDEMVGSWEQVVDMEIICRPEFERLGVAAYEGFYILTRESGVQSLNEALRKIHALQEAHRQEHGHWGGSLEALGFTGADARLSLELAVDAENETWIARGTHAMGIRRCAVSGGNVTGGEGSAVVTIEDPAAPTCRRMPAGDDSFPRLAPSNSGSH